MGGLWRVVSQCADDKLGMAHIEHIETICSAHLELSVGKRHASVWETVFFWYGAGDQQSAIICDGKVQPGLRRAHVNRGFLSIAVTRGSLWGCLIHCQDKWFGTNLQPPNVANLENDIDKCESCCHSWDQATLCLSLASPSLPSCPSVSGPLGSRTESHGWLIKSGCWGELSGWSAGAPTGCCWGWNQSK